MITLSSGETAKATTDDNPITLIDATDQETIGHLTIINEGGVAGFFSVDGGETWLRLPANGARSLDGLQVFNQAIQAKRVAGGSNLSGVYADAW